MKKYAIRKILIVTLSNIGDVVLTCPVIDAVIQHFPSAEVSVIVGPKARTLLEGSSRMKQVIVYEKQQRIGQIFAWFQKLRKEHFDVVIDLRNTALGYFLGASFRTSALTRIDPLIHKRHQHWQRLRAVFPEITPTTQRHAIVIGELARQKAEAFMRVGLETGKFYCVVAAGSADQNKRWTQEGFVSVCQALIQNYNLPIFLIGDILDYAQAEKIVHALPGSAFNLCGKLSLLESTWVLRHSRFLLCNDSAAMHLASYFNIPVLALFGPTDPCLYGPWGDHGHFLKAKSTDEFGRGVMASIDAAEVLQGIEDLLR